MEGNKGLKVNLGKTKVVVSGAEGEVTVSKVDPCGSCGRQNEMAILRKTERAMVRAMCGAKLMEMLGLKETAAEMAKANRMRWYRHVLRKD